MGEFRQDQTTGTWVIIAPERGDRPVERPRRRPPMNPAPEFSPSCPFCPGNESMLPGIIEEVAGEDAPGWRVRVVPNKYPALQPEPASGPDSTGRQPGAAAYGHHEVIVESPRHNADLASRPDAEIGTVMAEYQRRYVDLVGRPRINAVVVFRNHGGRSGASLAHPHAQAIALGAIPPQMSRLGARARRRYRRDGRCLACDEIERERRERLRVIEEGAHFLAYVPFAASGPYELRIAPKRHAASFAEATAAELADLGVVLGRTLRALAEVADDPPYNFVIDSAGRRGVAAPHQHWRVRVLPRLVTPGGFELGSGVPINPSLPERDAAALREAGTGR
jgi:UDPglucose--hexose-1-phosphate uridylyltransferase